MAEVVVFDIDAGSAIQKLVQLRESTKLLKEEQKRLAEQVEAGNETSAEAAKSYEANAIILKNLASEQRNLSRQVEGYSQVQKQATDTTNFANNSIQQNRDLLKQLTAQYVGMQKPSAEATKRIKDLSDELKKQESAIGDNRRNVGNYSDALSGLGGGIGKAITGVKGFNAALSANPIGAVVQLFNLLFSAFQSNSKVADEITFIMAGLNKVFQTIIDTVVKLLPDFTAVFNDPKKAAMDFVEFIKNQFIKRIEAIGIAFGGLQKILKGEFEAGLKDVGNAFIQFNTGIENGIDKIKQFGNELVDVAKEGRDAAKALDAFIVSSGRLDIAIKKNEQEIKALTFALKDRTKSEQERIEIAEKIFALETDISNKQIQKAKELLAAEELKLKGKTLSADEEIKLEKLRADVVIAQSDKQIAQKQKETRINILLEREQTKSLAEEKQKQKEIQENYFKQATDFQRKYIEEFLTGVEKELELLDLQQEQRREFLIEAGLSDLEITEKFRKERLAIIDKYAEKELEIQKNNAQELLQVQQNLADAEFDLQQSKIQVVGAVSSILSNIVGEQNEINKVLLAAEKAAAIAQVITQTQQANAAITAGVLSIPAFLPPGIPNPAFALAAAAGGKQLLANKIQAGISIAAIAAQAIQSFKPKENTVDTTLPRFADGGGIDINGQSHAQGGEVVTVGGRAVAEVEGGEGLYVMKKNAYQAIKQFSAINEAFGGKSWLKGSSKYLADGGAINAALPALESRNRVNSSLEQNRLLQQALKQLPAPVLSIKEFETKQANKDKSVRVSEL